MGLRICAYRYIHFRSNGNQLLRSISVDLDMKIHKISNLNLSAFWSWKRGRIEIKISRKKNFDRLLKDLAHLVLPAMVVEKKQSALGAAPFCSREALSTCYF